MKSHEKRKRERKTLGGNPTCNSHLSSNNNSATPLLCWWMNQSSDSTRHWDAFLRPTLRMTLILNIPKLIFPPYFIDTGSYMAFSKRDNRSLKMDRVSAELKRRQSGHSVSPSVLPQFHPRLRRTTGLDYVHKNWAAGRNQKEESTVGPDIGQTAGHPITEVNLSLNFPSNLREG